MQLDLRLHVSTGPLFQLKIQKVLRLFDPVLDVLAPATLPLELAFQQRFRLGLLLHLVVAHLLVARAAQQLAGGAGPGHLIGDSGGQDRVHESRLTGVWNKGAEIEALSISQLEFCLRSDGNRVVKVGHRKVKWSATCCPRYLISASFRLRNGSFTPGHVRSLLYTIF